MQYNLALRRIVLRAHGIRIRFATRHDTPTAGAARLFATYVTADYMPLVPSTANHTAVVDGQTKAVTSVVRSSVYNGIECMTETDTFTGAGKTSAETDYGICSRKRGDIEYGERIVYTDGTLMEVSAPNGMNEYPATLVPGTTTTYSDMPLKLVYHPPSGRMAGTGRETRKITVVGIDPVHSRLDFPHALKLIVEKERDYTLKSKTGRTLSLRETVTLTEWCAWAWGG